MHCRLEDSMPTIAILHHTSHSSGSWLSKKQLSQSFGSMAATFSNKSSFLVMSVRVYPSTKFAYHLRTKMAT